MINEVTLWCPLMLQLLVFCLWVPKGRAFSCATLVSKGIRKAGRQPLADLVGQLHREGGGGGLGLLKLQLQVLKKRRVLTPPVGLARADARRNLTARQSPQTEKRGYGGTRTAVVLPPPNNMPGFTHWAIGLPVTSSENIIYGFGPSDEIF